MGQLTPMDNGYSSLQPKFAHFLFNKIGTENERYIAWSSSKYLYKSMAVILKYDRILCEAM